MDSKQLLMIAKYELEKEQKLAGEYQYVQQHIHSQQEKLSGLEQHQLSYLTKFKNVPVQALAHCLMVNISHLLTSLIRRVRSTS